jgi:hypothetical protein
MMLTLAAVSFTASATVLKTGLSRCLLPSFAGVTLPLLGAVLDHLRSMKSSFCTCETLYNHFGVLINQYSHIRRVEVYRVAKIGKKHIAGCCVVEIDSKPFGQGLKLTNCAGIRANKGFRQVQKSNEFIRSSAKACPRAKNSQRLPAIFATLHYQFFMVESKSEKN